MTCPLETIKQVEDAAARLPALRAEALKTLVPWVVGDVVRSDVYAGAPGTVEAIFWRDTETYTLWMRLHNIRSGKPGKRMVETIKRFDDDS